MPPVNSRPSTPGIDLVYESPLSLCYTYTRPRFPAISNAFSFRLVSLIRKLISRPISDNFNSPLVLSFSVF